MRFSTVRLGSVAEFEREGIDPQTIPPETTYVGLEHISSEGIFIKPPKVQPGDLGSTKFVFSERHVLFGKLRPYLRKIARPTFSGICSTDIIPISPSSKLDRNYLFHYLRTDAVIDRATSMASGANLPRVSPKHLIDFEVPLPPLDEQRRIAAILDQADALRRTRHVALAKLSSLKHAIFLELFGDPVQNKRKWQRVPFGDLLSGIESGWSPTCLDRPAGPEEWGVLKLSAVTTCTFDDTEQKALPKSVKPRPSIEVRPGDVLFSRKNTYDLVGACALVRSTKPRLMLSDLIFRLQISDPEILVPDYLQALLACPTKRKEIQKLAGGSAGSMPNISKERLKGIDIELPPVQLQKAFANRIAQLEKLIGTYQSYRSHLDTLFASLQHCAFRGEL